MSYEILLFMKNFTIDGGNVGLLTIIQSEQTKKDYFMKLLRDIKK